MCRKHLAEIISPNPDFIAKSLDTAYSVCIPIWDTKPAAFIVDETIERYSSLRTQVHIECMKVTISAVAVRLVRTEKIAAKAKVIVRYM